MWASSSLSRLLTSRIFGTWWKSVRSVDSIWLTQVGQSIWAFNQLTGSSDPVILKLLDVNHLIGYPCLSRILFLFWRKTNVISFKNHKSIRYRSF
jgi:hypothetical protein